MNAQPQLYYAKLLELHRKQETGTGQGSTEKQKKKLLNAKHKC